MAKATIDPRLQVLIDKVVKDFERELALIQAWNLSREDTRKAVQDKRTSLLNEAAKIIEQEVILLGIQDEKFTSEDILRLIQRGNVISRPVAKELQELLKPAPPNPPKPKSTRKGKQMSRLLPVLRDLFPPDGMPPDSVKTVTVMQRVLKTYEVRRWGEVSRDVVERAIGRRKR
jgi:hypothetical protein